MLLGSDEIGPNGQPMQYVVRRPVVVGGESLVDAQPTLQNNQPVVSFRFDSAGGRKFGQATQQNVGQLLAIVLDDKVISAPRVNQPTRGSRHHQRPFHLPERHGTRGIAARRRTASAFGSDRGAVGGPGTRRGFDPLGRARLRGGRHRRVHLHARVLRIGVGLIANLALVVNLILVFALMSFLGATLTLPGIAGIVLVIGQAVDSNVLIYERIHEEVKNGRSPIASLDVGFNEALRTIVDSNVTSFIAGIALFIFGTGPVKGFAVTHCIGIVTTMFTAVTFTRLVVAYWYKCNSPA